MKTKNQRNYLDFVPVKNPDIEYQTDESGIVTLFVEWTGFYHRIAQKFSIGRESATSGWMPMEVLSGSPSTIPVMYTSCQKHWMLNIRIWRNHFPD